MTSPVAEAIYEGIIRYIYPFSRLMPRELDIDEKRKRLMGIAGSLFALPILFYFTVVDARSHETMDLFIDGGLALMLLGGIAVLGRVKNGIWIYRAELAGFTVLCSYNAFVTPGGESSMLWTLLYPPLAFFILGIPEGFFWFAGMFTVTIVVVNLSTFPALQVYSADMRLKYFIVLSIIAFFSLAYELLRWHFYKQLKRRSDQLASALDNVHTLSGLIPICSICKRIRDDRGYWNQLEDYLTKHTDAVMSHGICDSCMEKHYPEVYLHRKKTEKMNV